MDWKAFWNNRAEMFPERLAQVGRGDGSGYAEEAERFEKTLNHIFSTLKVEEGMPVLDLCCGNGLISHALAEKGAEVLGIDFAEKLLKIAKKKAPKNARFIQGDALDLEGVVEEKFDRILLHFSLQYFTKEKEVRTLFKSMANLCSPGGMILVSDIPDSAKVGAYYTTPKDKLRRMWHKFKGQDDMGKFWKRKQLVKICSELGLSAEALDQPETLPYAHYRFDLIIRP